MNMANSQPQVKRSGKQYVRTFLFSMKLGAPLTHLHVLTKFLGIIILSFIVIRVMDENHPDLIMAAVLFLLSMLTLYLGGVTRWLFRSYIVIIFPMFLFLFITWVAFMPGLGNVVYLRLPIYSGKINFGISVAFGAFLLSLILGYSLTRKFSTGFWIGAILGILIANFTSNSGVIFASWNWWKPYDFIVSDQNSLVAGTKVLGYASMVFMTLMLVMTTRDNELTAALRQLRVPYIGRFFLSIVFRTLSLTLMDFETIRQAQIARGIHVRRSNILTILRNMALMSVPLVATMLRRSSEIGDALQARGFALNRPGREFFEIRGFQFLDFLVLLIIIALAVLVLGFPSYLFQLLKGG